MDPIPFYLLPLPPSKLLPLGELSEEEEEIYENFLARARGGHLTFEERAIVDGRFQDAMPGINVRPPSKQELREYTAEVRAKHEGDHIRRPMNAYLIFCGWTDKTVPFSDIVGVRARLHRKYITRMRKFLWALEPDVEAMDGTRREVKARWLPIQEMASEEHSELFPGWKFKRGEKRKIAEGKPKPRRSVKVCRIS